MPRVVRQAENQKLFREVNERIAELSGMLDERDVPPSFFCECDRVGCREMIQVPLATYRIVRDEDDTYVVLHGHEDHAQEQTVSDHDVFLIVRTLRSKPTLTAEAVPG